MRAFKCFNSLEADFRRTREETGEELASELLMKRAGYGMEPVRINRAGRCLTVWKEELREEKEWLDEYPLMSEEDKRFSREADERLRREQKEQEAEELRRAAAEEEERKKREAMEEADKERRKAKFMASFGGLKWF